MGSETKGGHESTPLCMWLPAVLLMLMAIGLFASSRFVDGIWSAAAQFENPGTPRPIWPQHAELSWHQIVTLLGSLLVAAAVVFAEIFGRRANRAISFVLIRFMQILRGAQSGRIGDYISWLIFGVAAYGGILLLMERR